MYLAVCNNTQTLYLKTKQMQFNYFRTAFTSSPAEVTFTADGFSHNKFVKNVSKLYLVKVEILSS